MLRNMIKRAIEPELHRLLREYPIVTLLGPRHAGKTTLARQALPDYHYVNLEQPEIRQFAEQDPKAFLSLAGRTALLHLLPLSIAELNQNDPGSRKAEEYIYQGFLPRVHDQQQRPTPSSTGCRFSKPRLSSTSYHPTSTPSASASSSHQSTTSPTQVC